MRTDFVCGVFFFFTSFSQKSPNVNAENHPAKMASCSASQEVWGEDSSGGNITRVTLRAGDLTARIISYGCIVVCNHVHHLFVISPA